MTRATGRGGLRGKRAPSSLWWSKAEGRQRGRTRRGLVNDLDNDLVLLWCIEDPVGGVDTRALEGVCASLCLHSHTWDRNPSQLPNKIGSTALCSHFSTFQRLLPKQDIRTKSVTGWPTALDRWLLGGVWENTEHSLLLGAPGNSAGLNLTPSICLLEPASLTDHRSS